MIAIRSMDEERKRLGLGMGEKGGGGRRRGEMEGNEIEVGEAYSCLEDDIDPDALSYIDEKIQHVLGHFQKEFEDGVSADSLGAKFGGYGSFLPAYQRSPSILSQPRSPAKIPNKNVSRSPCNMQPQDGHQNSSVPGITPSIAKDIIVSLGQPNEKSDKRKSSIITHSTEDISQHINKPFNSIDQKTLKVCIKVGPDNCLASNNPDIYSDSGLDVSQSPSLEDSPSGSGELSPETLDAFCESPTAILQIMACFSVPGGYLLSPLPKSLLHAARKQVSSLINFKTGMLHKGLAEAWAAPSETSLHLKVAGASTCKKSKLEDKSQRFNEADRLKCNGFKETFLKKEKENKTPRAQKVFCSAPDMLLSSSARVTDGQLERHLISDSINDSCNMSDNFKDQDKASLKGRIFMSSLCKHSNIELSESIRTDCAGNSEKVTAHSRRNMNSRSTLTNKAFEERSENSQDTSCELHSESGSKAHKNYDVSKADLNGHRGWKNNTDAPKEPGKKYPAHAAASYAKGVLMTIPEVDEVYGGSTLKANQSDDRLFTEPIRENLGAPTSEHPKGRKKMPHQKKLKAPKIPKEGTKGIDIDSHKGVGVSICIQDVDNNMHTLDPPGFIEMPKEGLGFNNVDNLLIAKSATYAKAIAPMTYNAPTSDAPSTVAAPIIKDNWVLCDLCQKWRLLPYGTDPDNLPKKWQCSMQVWLPGLNKCNISEDETTKTIQELYQVLAPVNVTNLTVHPDAAASSIISADPLNPGGRLKHHVCGISLAGKKKHGLMEAIKLLNDSSLSELANSGKKLQASSRNKALTDVTVYPLEIDSLFEQGAGHTKRSTALTIEKHSHKVKGKHSRTLPLCPDGGGIFGKGSAHYRSENKMQVDLEGHRSSKKIKKDESYPSVKDLHIDGDMVEKMTINEDSDFPAIVSSDRAASKSLKSKTALAKMPEELIGTFSNGGHKKLFRTTAIEKPGKSDSKNKKRKIKEWPEKQAHHESLMINKQIVESRPMVKDCSRVSELKRQKKTKVAKSEGKDSSSLIVDEKMNEKCCSTRISLSGSSKYLPNRIHYGSIHAASGEQKVHYQGNATSHHALECVDFMKKDVSYVWPVTAATSSSSMISGSQTSKANLRKARGSPVESVSSSPMRILNNENNSAKRGSSIKNNTSNMGSSLKGRTKRFSDCDLDGASDQWRRMTKGSSSKSDPRILEICKATDSGVLDSLKVSNDYQGQEAKFLSSVKTGHEMYLKKGTCDDFLSSNFVQANVMCEDRNAYNPPDMYPVEQSNKNHSYDQYKNSESGQPKYGKSSSHSTENLKDSNFGAEKGKLKVFDSYTDPKELLTLRRDNSCHSDTELDCMHLNRKDYLENYYKQHNVYDSRVTDVGISNSKPILHGNLQQASSRPWLDLSNQIIFDKSEGGSEKGVQARLRFKGKHGKMGWQLQTTPNPVKGIISGAYPVDAVNAESPKPEKQGGKFDGRIVVQSNILPRPTLSESCSSMKKDDHPNLNSFKQEARDLKHTASRFKNEGLEHESSRIFFEAALKFLNVAYLMEPSNAEITGHGELFPSAQMLQMYSETALLCEFCAREYENLKEMAAAALAYKCAEVAFMKVAYYKNPIASKDRHELQAILDAAIPGESPSSFASDVDNLNTQGVFEKSASTRIAASPQIASNHVIAARNCPLVRRLLIYTNYLNCAFEASNKSRNAVAASIELEKDVVESACSVREVIDFNFHNVVGLLRLVRGSLNSISQ